MKRKQIQRTCSQCKTVRYVDPNLSKLEVPKPISSFRRSFSYISNIEEHDRKTTLALSVCACPSCGSTSYKDKEVRV